MSIWGAVVGVVCVSQNSANFSVPSKVYLLPPVKFPAVPVLSAQPPVAGVVDSVIWVPGGAISPSAESCPVMRTASASQVTPGLPSG